MAKRSEDAQICVKAENSLLTQFRHVMLFQRDMRAIWLEHVDAAGA